MNEWKNIYILVTTLARLFHILNQNRLKNWTIQTCVKLHILHSDFAISKKTM